MVAWSERRRGWDGGRSPGRARIWKGAQIRAIGTGAARAPTGPGSWKGTQLPERAGDEDATGWTTNQGTGRVVVVRRCRGVEEPEKGAAPGARRVRSRAGRP